MSSVVIIIGEPDEGNEKLKSPIGMTVTVDKPGLELTKTEVLQALEFATKVMSG